MIKPAPKSHKVYIAAAVCLFIAHCSRYWRFTVDDSFISYRYAKHWADGLGPVYQAGERVEGYTSFAWIALLALARRFGIDIEFASKALGLAFGVLCIIGVAAISRRLLDGRPSYLAAPFALALNPLYAAWACSGMEASFFSAVVVWGAYALLSDHARASANPWSSVVFGLMALVRPEGPLFAATALIATAANRGKAYGRYVARWGLIFLAVVVPYWIWRTSYYGSFFPNTFYAKTGGGVERLIHGAWSVVDLARFEGPVFVALCALGLLSALRKSTAWTFVRLATVAFFAYVIWAGGDILHLRFFVHVMGLLAILATVGFDWISGKLAQRSSVKWAVGISLVALYAGFAGFQDVRALNSTNQFGAAYVVNNATNVQRANIPLARWLHEHAPAGSTLAAWDIGGLGYYSEISVIDVLGLTDRTLAQLIHRGASSAEQAAYIQGRRPDYIVAYCRAGRPRLKVLDAARDWVWRNYGLHSRWSGGPDGYGLALLVRKDVRMRSQRVTELE